VGCIVGLHLASCGANLAAILTWHALDKNLKGIKVQILERLALCYVQPLESLSSPQQLSREEWTAILNRLIRHSPRRNELPSCLVLGHI
jgi:hypothetical protein